jgi:hypothetical protein
VLKYACLNGGFETPEIHSKVGSLLHGLPPSRTLVICDSLYGLEQEPVWDKKEHKFGALQFRQLLAFGSQLSTDYCNVVFAVFVTDDQYSLAESVFTNSGLNCRMLIWYKGRKVAFGERLVQDHETILLAFKGSINDVVVNVQFAENRYQYSTVFHTGRVVNFYQYNGKTLNKYQKPLDVMDKLIQMFTRPGHLVIDVSGGTFTTGVSLSQIG